MLEYGCSEKTRCRMGLKEGYRLLRAQPPQVLWSKLVWSKGNNPRHDFILWLALLKKLRSRKWHYDKGIIDSDLCGLCSKGVYDINHMFFNCDFSSEVCRLVMANLKLKYRKRPTFEAWWCWWLKLSKGKTRSRLKRRTVLAIMVYILWNERNKRVFLQDSNNPEMLANSICNMLCFV
ncbi:hypothetical protein Droror1_Dr00018172 [Drosera rotundifolia]